jgi:hypothetical protein
MSEVLSEGWLEILFTTLMSLLIGSLKNVLRSLFFVSYFQVLRSLSFVLIFQFSFVLFVRRLLVFGLKSLDQQTGILLPNFYSV